MLYPLNKYLVVELIEEVKKQSGVLVPDGVSVDISTFKLVQVVQPNMDSRLNVGMKILVPTHMIEEASFFGEQYYLVTENHVVGFYEEK
jgi:co-chaperonin GroES (HSP10)